MTRKYKAKSHISISVVLKSGKSAHVAFLALTGGGSVYYTDDEELQEALKSHPKYGRLFKEEPMENNISQSKKPQEQKPQNGTSPQGAGTYDDDNDNLAGGTADDEENGAGDGVDDTADLEDEGEDNDADDAGDGLQKVNVTCLDDAKEYLVEKFGISRTKLRSAKSIVAAAADNGIEFVGI